MKFISKSSNLLVVLKPGIQAQPLTGTPAIPTLSVRFKDGVAEVKEEALVSMMLAHPRFNKEFVSADSLSTDPFVKGRKAVEPAHEMTQIKFGTPVARQIKGGDKPELTPAMEKIVKESAMELAKEMLPKMVKDTLEQLVKNKKKSGRKPGKKPGRKPGRKPVNVSKPESDIEEIPIPDEIVSPTKTVNS